MFLNKAYRFWTALIALIVSFAIAGGAFVASQVEAEETAPSTGAPSKSEAAEVSRLKEEFPVEAGTALFLVFTSDNDLTESQISTINDNLEAAELGEWDVDAVAMRYFDAFSTWEAE